MHPLPSPQVVDGGRHLYIVTEYASGGEVFGESPSCSRTRQGTGAGDSNHVPLAVVECAAQRVRQTGSSVE